MTDVPDFDISEAERTKQLVDALQRLVRAMADFEQSKNADACIAAIEAFVAKTTTDFRPLPPGNPYGYHLRLNA